MVNATTAMPAAIGIGGTVAIRRRREVRFCGHCGDLTGPAFDGGPVKRRSDVEYCSAACRQAAYRPRYSANNIVLLLMHFSRDAEGNRKGLAS
jgi:hypothetical protein